MKRICKFCEDEFTLTTNHRGLSTVCLESDCQKRLRSEGVHEPALLTGCMTWEGKQTPTLIIFQNPQESQRFAAQQRRHGAGVGMALTSGSIKPLVGRREAGYEHIPREVLKLGTNGGDLYYSKLGEKRSVKR